MERVLLYKPFLLILSVLLCFQCVCLGSTKASHNINTDQISLLALKSHLISDPLNMLTNNWTTKTPVCNWVGDICNHGRVTELDISDMGLVGTISPGIGNLSSLVSLNIMGNFFHGYIPPSIFNMSSLEFVSAMNNSLSGKLPDDMCSHGLGRVVKVIDLSYNELHGEIPSSIEHCSRLEMIALFMNRFSGRLPRETGNITGLTALFLSFNNLNGMDVVSEYHGVRCVPVEQGITRKKLYECGCHGGRPRRPRYCKFIRRFMTVVVAVLVAHLG